MEHTTTTDQLSISPGLSLTEKLNLAGYNKEYLYPQYLHTVASSPTVEDYTVEYKIFIFENRYPTLEEIEETMKGEEYHPGNIDELLKFVEIHPEFRVTRDKEVGSWGIIAIGSPFKHGGTEIMFPVTSSGNLGRSMIGMPDGWGYSYQKYLRGYEPKDGKFFNGFGFLGVRVISSEP